MQCISQGANNYNQCQEFYRKEVIVEAYLNSNLVSLASLIIISHNLFDFLIFMTLYK